MGKKTAGSVWLNDPKNEKILDGLSGQWVAAGENGLIAHGEDYGDVCDQVAAAENAGSPDEIAFWEVPEFSAPVITRQ